MLLTRRYNLESNIFASSHFYHRSECTTHVEYMLISVENQKKICETKELVSFSRLIVLLGFMTIMSSADRLPWLHLKYVWLGITYRNDTRLHLQY